MALQQLWYFMQLGDNKSECEELHKRTLNYLVLNRFDLCLHKSICRNFVLCVFLRVICDSKYESLWHSWMFLSKLPRLSKQNPPPNPPLGEGQSKRWQSPGSVPPVALMSLKIHLTPLVWLNYSAWPWAAELILWDFNKQAGEEGQGGKEREKRENGWGQRGRKKEGRRDRQRWREWVTVCQW